MTPLVSVAYADFGVAGCEFSGGVEAWSFHQSYAGFVPSLIPFSFSEAKSSGSVSFVLPSLGTDSDVDYNSVAAVANPPSEGLSRISRLIA